MTSQRPLINTSLRNTKIFLALFLAFSFNAHAGRSFTFSIYPLPTTMWRANNVFLECGIVNVSNTTQTVKVKGNLLPAAATRSNLHIEAGSPIAEIDTVLLMNETYSKAWGTGHFVNFDSYGISSAEVPHQITIQIAEDRGAIQVGCVFYYWVGSGLTAHAITVNGGRPF